MIVVRSLDSKLPIRSHSHPSKCVGVVIRHTHTLSLMFRSAFRKYKWSLEHWFYMNWTALFALLELHLMKKEKVNQKISSIRFKCQRLLQRYQRTLNIQNNLLSCLFMLIDDPMNNSNRLIWSYPKSNRW